MARVNARHPTVIHASTARTQTSLVVTHAHANPDLNQRVSTSVHGSSVRRVTMAPLKTSTVARHVFVFDLIRSSAPTIVLLSLSVHSDRANMDLCLMTTDAAHVSVLRSVVVLIVPFKGAIIHANMVNFLN